MATEAQLNALAVIVSAAQKKFKEPELAVLAGVTVGLGLAIIDYHLGISLVTAAEEILNGDGQNDPNTPQTFVELAGEINGLLADEAAAKLAEDAAKAA